MMRPRAAFKQSGQSRSLFIHLYHCHQGPGCIVLRINCTQSQSRRRVSMVFSQCVFLSSSLYTYKVSITRKLTESSPALARSFVARVDKDRSEGRVSEPNRLLDTNSKGRSHILLCNVSREHIHWSSPRKICSSGAKKSIWDNTLERVHATKVTHRVRV